MDDVADGVAGGEGADHAQPSGDEDHRITCRLPGCRDRVLDAGGDQDLPLACGEISSVDLRCAHCGEPMHAGDVDPLPGPGAAA